MGEKVLKAIARAYFERAFRSGRKSRIRGKLGDVVDLLTFQDHLLGALALSKSMGPVLFEAGKKVAKYVNSESYPLYSNLPDYRDIAKAENPEEARLSTLFVILEAEFRSTRSGLIKLTEFEKDKLIVCQIEECAECYGIGNIGMNVCYYNAGAIAGILETLFGRSVGFLESKCYAKGDPCCEFRYNLSEKVGNDKTIEK